MNGPPWYTSPPDPRLTYGQRYVEEFGVPARYFRAGRRMALYVSEIEARFARFMDKREPREDSGYDYDSNDGLGDY